MVLVVNDCGPGFNSHYRRIFHNSFVQGFVLFHGERWKAISRTTIMPGQKIIAREGLTLIVEPINE